MIFEQKFIEIFLLYGFTQKQLPKTVDMSIRNRRSARLTQRANCLKYRSQVAPSDDTIRH